RVAKKQVEAEGQDREDRRHDEHVQVVGVRDPPRRRHRCAGAERDGRARDQPMRSARAKSPAGRKSSTRMIATKPTASRERDETYRAPSSSATPSSEPPSVAPARFPRPPRMTTEKAFSEARSPIEG